MSPLDDGRQRHRAPLLELRGINKSFGPVHVLHDVDFDVYPGQVTALVGDNGAGKSTLVKCVAGIYAIDTGEFLFDGQAGHVHGPQDAAALGIEVVYQDLALCDNLDIVQNMFLGREHQDRRRARRGADGDGAPARRSPRSRCGPSSPSASWSPACPAASARPSRSPRPCSGTRKVVMLDEPTAALGVAQTEQVLALVRRLADSGLGVVIISHNMNDVLEVADRICALYLGRVAADIPLDGTVTA